LTVGVQAERQEQRLPGFFPILSQSLKEINILRNRVHIPYSYP
jgi:hypothetical protein